MDSNILQIFASLGIPGIIIGVFFLLLYKFNFKFSTVSKGWTGTIVVLFLVIIAIVTIYSLSLWSPSENKGDSENKEISIKMPDGDELKEMADQGDETAQYLLAVAYEKGLKGYPKDLDMAIFWYTESASKGFKASIKRIKFLKSSY